MSREFAKKFYNTKTWKDTREAYFLSKFGLCELCEKPGEEVHHKIFITPQNINDPEITTSWDNLQLLCKTCHSVQHDKAYQLHREYIRKNSSTQRDMAFDDNGELVERKSVHVVWGAPCSGKTSYVREHKGEYDIVVDLDYIMSALSLSNSRERSPDTFPFALECVRLLHDAIAERKYHFDHAWIVTTMPNKNKREQLIKQLRADSIHIDTDMDTCIARARADTDRADKELQYKIIKKYFDELEI